MDSERVGSLGRKLRKDSASVWLMTCTAFWEVIGAYVLVLSAELAWYTATSLMLKGVGTPILPVGETEKAKEGTDFDIGAEEPGVQHGQ